MTRFLNIALLALLFSLTSNAQVDSVYSGTPSPRIKEKPRKERNNEWKERMTFGGNMQLQFGTYTFIFLSPTIGFIPFERVNVGAGIIYNYININYGGSYGSYSQSIWGTHTYARYYVTDEIFLQGQFDRLFQPAYTNVKNDMVWVDYGMVGGGFRQPIGDKAGLTTSIMYNLTPNALSIYPFRVVLQFGFISTF